MSLIGGARYEVHGRPSPIGSDGIRILAFLGVHGRTERRVVAGALWPDTADSRASGSLRTGLWRLRQAGISLVDRPAAFLSLPDDVEVDTSEFVSWAARLRRADRVTVDDLDLSRVPRDDLLPGWSEPWVLAERERLHQHRLYALEVLAVEFGRRGRLTEAVTAARRAADIDPLRESSARILVELYLRQNDVGRAVRRFETYRRHLVGELGIEPSADFVAMLDRSVRRSPLNAPSRSTAGRVDRPCLDRLAARP